MTFIKKSEKQYVSYDKHEQVWYPYFNTTLKSEKKIQQI